MRQRLGERIGAQEAGPEHTYRHAIPLLTSSKRAAGPSSPRPATQHANPRTRASKRGAKATDSAANPERSVASPRRHDHVRLLPSHGAHIHATTFCEAGPPLRVAVRKGGAWGCGPRPIRSRRCRPRGTVLHRHAVSSGGKARRALSWRGKGRGSS